MSTFELEHQGIECHREFEGPIRRFQVLGERASGTNYMQALMHKNTDVQASAHLGWKHGFPQAQFYPRDMLVIVCFRHVLPWVRSMYRKPWHITDDLRDISFSDFLRSPWLTEIDNDLWWDDRMNEINLEPASTWVPGLFYDRVATKIRSRLKLVRKRRDMSVQAKEIALGTSLQLDRHPITGEHFSTVFELRTAKSLAYLGHRVRQCNYVFVQYEKIKKDPDQVLQKMADTFSFKYDGNIRPVGKWFGELTYTQEKSSHQPPERIEDPDMKFIRDRIDVAVEKSLGYRPLLATEKSS